MSELTPQRIWVVGSLNLDFVVTVAHHPHPGETVMGGDYATYPGGKGANQAVAMAKLGAQVDMVGRVGDDPFGQQLRHSLESHGVGTHHLKTLSGSSGLAVIVINAAGENTIVVSPGANGRWTVADLPPLPEDVGLVLLQLEIPLEVVVAVVAAAQARGIPVLFNPAPVQILPSSIWQGITFLVVNATEAALLSGLPVNSEMEALSAAKILHRLGASTVIVTLGSQGVVWVNDEREGFRAAQPVTVVDTTAAGDAFCGAFAVGWMETGSLVSAIEMATAVAALTVTKAGAQPSLPTRAELAEFVAEF